jgi:hypothetical protein
MSELTGRTCNEKGRVLSESGGIFYLKLVEEDKGEKSNASTGGNNKNRQAQLH